jgi:hypothetical protein
MKPNWQAAPDFARWAAQELSGTWYFHEERPRFQELTGEWVSTGQRLIVPRVSVQAKDTLEGRPA